MTTTKSPENLDISELANLEKTIGYKFKNRKHLIVATTHSSFCNEENYERYEFLGDSIVNFVVGKYLFNNVKNVDEGTLTKMRSALICGPSLSKLAKKLNIGQYIRLSKGEIQNQGRTRESILEDAVEAICAAIYLDCNDFNKTEEIVLELFSDLLKSKENFKSAYRDPKTLLQEIIQDKFKTKPLYELLGTEGKSHNQTFYTACEVKELNLTTRGVAKNKRQAEQAAASQMIRELRALGLLSREHLSRIDHI